MPKSKSRRSATSPSVSHRIPLDFPDVPNSSKVGHFIVAYDISCPKRLRKVANCCLDYGFRAQYSIFECRLTWPQFETFWAKLLRRVDPCEDRLLAFPVHAQSIPQIRRLGKDLSLHPKQCYVF